MSVTDLAAGDTFVDFWQGAPFAWDGRSRAGVDCWGLAAAFHAAVHRAALPDWIRGDHTRAWISRTIAEQARSHWRSAAQPHDGCMVLVLSAAPTQGRAMPHHVGIYWRGSVLHAAEARGVILERLADFAALHPHHEFGDYLP